MASLQNCPSGTVSSSDCLATPSTVVTTQLGTLVDAWSNSNSTTTVSALLPQAFYKNQICSFTDNNLIAENIVEGSAIFNVAGSFPGNFSLHTASNALRDPGVRAIANWTDLVSTSIQLTLNSEITTYAAADLPTTGGYSYRDIPDQFQDDDGESGVNCKYAPRPTVDCGMIQATIALRLADCQTANPTANSWDGSTQCSAGQGLWRLVTRSGANNEVWQDQRTGLLWSSVVNSSIDWCRASGNTQLTPLAYLRSYNTAAGTPIVGNGTIGALSSGINSDNETITITFSDPTTFAVTGTSGAGGCQGGAIVGGLTLSTGSTATYTDLNECSFTLTQGSVNFAANDTLILKNIVNASHSCLPGGPLQPGAPVSYCAEAASLNPGIGDDWITPVYMPAKGGLGKNSVPSVRWRAPSISDYNQADINGIRFVMPDAGLAGVNRPTPDVSQGSYGHEWSTTLESDRDRAWRFHSARGSVASNLRNGLFPIRCVGR